MKTCHKCSETKPVAEFSKRAKSPDGMSPSCKACVAVYKSAHYAANRAEILAKHVAYYAANREKCKASNSAWSKANPDKRKSISAKYYAANKGTINVRSAIWQKENRGICNDRTAVWRANNPEKVKAQHSSWCKANAESCRIYTHNRSARKIESGGKLSPGLSERLLKLQRGKCACGCGQMLGDDYHLDHRMPLALGGSNTDDNMQLLTATCNLQKGAKHPVSFMQQRGFLL